MADDIPVLEIKIEPDFSAVDEGIAKRQQGAAGGAATFGSEGRKNLPGAGVGPSAVDAAVDRMAQAIDRATASVSKFAAHAPRDPETGRFTSWNRTGLGHGVAGTGPGSSPGSGLGFGNWSAGLIPPPATPYSGGAWVNGPGPQASGAAGLGYGWNGTGPGTPANVGSMGSFGMGATPKIGPGGLGWGANGTGPGTPANLAPGMGTGLGYGQNGTGPGATNNSQGLGYGGWMNGGNWGPPIGGLQEPGGDDDGGGGREAQVAARYARYKSFIRNRNINAFFNKNMSISRRAVMGIMYGGFEISHAHRAISHGQISSALSEDSGEALERELAGIESASGGVIGSTLGLALDTLGIGPQQLRNQISYVVSSRADDKMIKASIGRVSDASRSNAASWGGNFETAKAHALNEQASFTRHAVAERSELTDEIARLGERERQIHKHESWGWESNGTLTDAEQMELIDIRNKRSSIGNRLKFTELEGTSVAASTQNAIALAGRDLHMQRMDISAEGMHSGMVADAYATGGLSGRALTSRAGQGFMFERGITLGRQALQLENAKALRAMWVTNPQNAPALQESQAEGMRGYENQSNEARSIFDFHSKLSAYTTQIGLGGEIRSNQLNAQFKPFSAGLNDRVTAMWASIVTADSADVAATTVAGMTGINAYVATETRQRQIQSINVVGRTTVSKLRARHDPLAASLKELRISEAAELAGIPEDNEQLRTETRAEYKARREQTAQAHKDRRYMETMGLKRKEGVTELLSTAFGPGANMKRMQAQVMETSGAAEERAEARLINDRTDILNADRERRIGINELKSQKAQYLEGFSAKEGSLNRTALSAAETTENPTTILKNIDKGIKELTNKLGSLVAGD